MEKELELQLTALLEEPILSNHSLAGGDISKAYLLNTGNGRLFCKIHNSTEAYAMFKAEEEGLKVISNTGVIKSPSVICCRPLKKGACLILEYIDSKSPSAKDMQKLGYQIAELHSTSSDVFGFDKDNYIGSLYQSNKKHKDWISFYTRERLYSQLQLAKNNNLLTANEVPQIDAIESRLRNLCPTIKPALLHGDLWSGNYLISSDGVPYLIDPAAFFGHHELDIAMTKLFGGFDKMFYTAYEDIIPKSAGWEEREQVYQLYYLLVHLNIFGRSYYPAVINIIKRYF